MFFDIIEVDGGVMIRLRYRKAKTGLMYFFVFLLLSALLLLGPFLYQYQSIKSSYLQSVETDLSIYSDNIDTHFSFVASDILLLEDIIMNKDIFVLDQGSVSFTSQADLDSLEMDLVDWIQSESIYDQIRIIGIQGTELVRVNYNQGSPVIVAEADLQDKSSRYYFQNSINLANDTLYLSKIDLNVENDEIEYIDGRPKQIYRIASTLFNSQNEKIGIIIVNYYVEDLFHTGLNENIDLPCLSVINQDGYFLQSEDETIEYGFMFDDKLDETFENYHGFDIFDKSGTDINQFTVSGKVFTSVIVDSDDIALSLTENLLKPIDVYSDNGPIVIYSAFSFNSINLFDHLISNYIIYFLISAVIVFVVSRLIDEINYNHKEKLKFLEYTSTHDTLTELPNRLSITKKMETLAKEDKDFYIMFLDLDGFKKINDSFGHHMGDKVLFEVGKRLKACMREEDEVARLGGDEFIVLFNDTDEMKLIEMKHQIEESISQVFIIQEDECYIGVSIGMWLYDGKQSVEVSIMMADQLMYKEKDMKKKESN